ncbi:MAG TPA: sigma-54 dependent transcriptional regulator [Planctomycetota bacterium]
MSVKAPPLDLQELRVLVVDDETDVRLGLQRLMERLGARVSSAASGAEALERFDADGADVVLSDLMMPGMSGAELLAQLKQRAPETEVIILTGFGTVPTAVSCLRDGASHFLTKPFDNAEVLGIVERAGRQLLARRRRRQEAGGRPTCVSADPRMARVMALVERVAPSQVPVLIEGESGTGKEVVARTLHALGPAPHRPFQAVNAAALPDALLESELFGHRRGAFTGADRDRDGLFALAAGGTVFLDEVASMSLAFQGKLLRVIQEKVVRPLGSSTDVPVEFRLVAATNCDLEGLIRAGKFREDLFYRLKVVSVHVPPLRERPGDVVPLAEHFLADAVSAGLPAGSQVPEFDPGALAALQAHNWPGNVRELENAVQRAVVVCWGARILPHHLGLDESAPVARAGGPATADYETGKRNAVERFQREFLERALERSGGNVSKAADACGLTRAALQRILRGLGIERERFVPR